MIKTAAPIPSDSPRWLRLLFWLLALLALLLLLALFHQPILRALGRAWIVHEPVTVKVDAIVVPSGGLGTRPAEAARLYHSGVAPRILIMNVRSSPAEKMGLLPSETFLTAWALLSNNVPLQAIVPLGRNIGSTYDEARAVAAWATNSGNAMVVIPTDQFHTRRARWIFARQLRPAGAQAMVRAVPSPSYSASDWWQHEQGLSDFVSEVCKHLYYRWHY